MMRPPVAGLLDHTHSNVRPVPPGGTERSKDARWLDIYEGDAFEARMATWVKQAAGLPGWVP